MLERVLFYGLMAFVALAAVLPLVPVGAWVVRLFDFPRVQLLVLCVAATLGVVLRRASFGGAEFAGLILCGVAVAGWQASRILPYTPLWRPEAPAASPDEVERPLKLAVANLAFDNEQREEVPRQLLATDADLLVVIEVDEAWAADLEPLHEAYPQREGAVLPKGHGLTLYSRLPIEEAEVRYLVSDDRPSIHARITGPGGAVIRFVAVHPTPPGLYDPEEGDRHDSRLRDAELMLVAKEIAADPDHNWVVTGDFNDVAWSHTTRLFKRVSGLKDPRIGRGLFNTYHARIPVLRFPIDHVFLPAGARLVSLDRFVPEGSDHFAITAQIAFPRDAQAKPEPVKDDRGEAEELIEEGKQDAADRGREAE